jgi:NADH:ubiquinone reductase (non-electrogenic)
VIYLLEWAARLVLALGAEAKIDAVPGSAEYAIPFTTLEHALVRINYQNKMFEVQLFIMYYLV